MPCTDGGPGPEYYAEVRAYKDGFCSACTALEEAGIKIPPTAHWLWLKHKQEDGERQAREDADAMRRELKAKALAKLSPAERDALGLR